MPSPSRITTTTVAARIPYANAAPFYAHWADAPFAVRNLVPRDLGREAEAGAVDLGLMAAADYLRLRDRFEQLAPPLGVAARGPVQSVRLLKLLFDVRRGFTGVRYVRGLEPTQADALLVIGDNAMRMRHKRPEGFTHTLDLGADWLEWTGHSFVYAVWAVRRALDLATRVQLGRFLESSLAAGLANLAEVARQTTEPGWTTAEMEAYLRRFRYRLGPEDIAGLERFEALLIEHRLLDSD